MNFRCFRPIQGIVLIATLWLVSACELLYPIYQPTVEQVPESSLCITQAQLDDFDDFCNISNWFEFVVEAQELTWPARLQMISDLDDQTESLVKKVLLSQGVNTPYQHRLRSQTWIVKLMAVASDTMKIVLNELIYENSKQLLEFESAITILSRVNARQEKTISELEQKLIEQEQAILKQQDQVEQLLRIETDLIEQNRNEKR